MDPARGTPRTGTKRGRTTILGLASTLVGACAAVVLLAAPALAALPSTTITPAGDSFTASLKPGTTADFTTGNVTVSCNQSSTSGQVPAAPGNNNPSGPVSIPITPPTFTNDPPPCPTNQFFVTATTTSSGSWTIQTQFNTGGSTATLIVPPGGVVITTSGLASCTVTVGSTQINGTLVAGDPTTSPITLPELIFSNVTLPISVTGGFGCPTAQTSGTFTATYEIADTTNPGELFTVTA